MDQQLGKNVRRILSSDFCKVSSLSSRQQKINFPPGFRVENILSGWPAVLEIKSLRKHTGLTKLDLLYHTSNEKRSRGQRKAKGAFATGNWSKWSGDAL